MDWRKEQIRAVRDRGSAWRQAARGQEAVLYDPEEGEEHEVTAVVYGIREGGELGQGGVMLEMQTGARWRKADGPEPAVGWLLRLRDLQGRTFEVERVHHDAGSAEWRVELREVS